MENSEHLEDAIENRFRSLLSKMSTFAQIFMISA